MPASDGILESRTFVVGKEVPDVLIVFELRLDFLWGLDGVICRNRFLVCLTRIVMEPVLKLSLKMEALPYMLHKESTKFLRAHYVLRNDIIQRDTLLCLGTNQGC